MADLDTEDLTDKQFALVWLANPFPAILTRRGQVNTAASLERAGWGVVEPGASGERIFRLSQDGSNALVWLNADEAPHDLITTNLSGVDGVGRG